MSRGTLLSGFPWACLAYSLCRFPFLIQTADIWGPYGIGFTIVLVNLAIWHVHVSMKVRTSKPSCHSAIWSVALALCLMGFILVYGNHKSSHPWQGNVRVAAIQGAFDQSVKWDPAYRLATMERYTSLTKKAKQQFPDLSLVVWPETAMPFYFQEGGQLKKEIEGLARELHVSILFGNPSYFYDSTGRLRYRNSAYLLGPDGSSRGRYDKQHLVPFGEYMPWGKLTSWARDFVPTAGDFSAGRNPAPLASGNFRIGVMICFESIFPEISAKEVKKGANILAVITNDAWFGRTAAPFQHADMAVFRAVETRRWLIRAANTGVSRIIAPSGKIMASTQLFTPCFISGLVRLEHGKTFFVRYGAYWFFLLNLLFILMNYIKTWLEKRNDHGKNSTG
ncbi:MAG: apolipoprotein N-acyltransferase [Thermodesulfatator sp.]|nr:MAG: apolipoprotein N-acyltransferase [Thermodesulfatator sp.]